MEKHNDNNIAFMSPILDQFIDNFSSAQAASINRKADNDKAIGSAVVYERIRTALEYQEEHLIFKNAIARIVRRRYALSTSISAQQLTADLINELSWANYLNPEAVKPEEYEKITHIVNRYLIFLKHIRSAYHKKGDLQKMVTQWMACEINELFYPEKERDVFLGFAGQVIGRNLLLEGAKVTPEENSVQLQLSIYSLVMKPDFFLMQYWLLRKVYPNWTEIADDEFSKIAQSFDPYYNKVNFELNHPLRKNYLQFVKRSVAPFTLLYRSLMAEKTDVAKLREKPQVLHSMILDQYNRAVKAARDKVWRGTFRALIFILFTKVSLAFLIEAPFERYFIGSINYLTLAINVFLPPTLMLIAGTFVKSPPARNYKTVSDSVTSLINSGVIIDKPTLLMGKKHTFADNVFSSIYFIFTLAIVAAVIWLLLTLGFNALSITLFFVFVSAVSFFSFRIRNIALELAMKRTKDDALTSTIEFLFLPFIRIGRYLSDQIAAFNPFILALDFLIEAPLKSIIKITNSWFRFVNSKKEDLEF